MSYIISELLTEDQVSQIRSTVNSSQDWVDGIKSIISHKHPSNNGIKKNLELNHKSDAYQKACPIIFNALLRCVDWADFTVFDEHEARLSDFIIEYVPEAESSFIGYLASDENDTFYEGKFKNMLEGGFLGTVADGTFRLAKYIKDMRKARAENNLPKAQKIANQRKDEILQNLNEKYGYNPERAIIVDPSLIEGGEIGFTTGFLLDVFLNKKRSKSDKKLGTVDEEGKFTPTEEGEKLVT